MTLSSVSCHTLLTQKEKPNRRKADVDDLSREGSCFLAAVSHKQGLPS